jgi:hypothetical protein
VKLFSELATFISFINVKPETRQNGNNTRKVNIMDSRRDGVCPGFINSPDRRNIRKRDATGLREKIRFILFMSLSIDLLAIAAPAAEPISHEARKIPVINS